MLKPLNNRVIIKPTKEEEFSVKGGIILNNSVNTCAYGTVVQVVENEDVRVGDVVVYNKHSGIPVDHEGEEYLMMKLDEILGVGE